MSNPDEKYADIQERKRRVRQVKGKLHDCVTKIQEHVGKLEGDEVQYYVGIVECAKQLWGAGWFVDHKLKLPEAERRIREVVRPTLEQTLGINVRRYWFMFREEIENIEADVKKWFGEQTTDEALTGQCLYGLYEISEYQHPAAYALAGLAALKEAGYAAYLDVSLARLYAAKLRLQWVLGSMWELQAARQAFETAVAGAATPGTRAAAAEIDGMLDAVLSDVDKLVSMLVQAQSAESLLKTEDVKTEDAKGKDDKGYEVLFEDYVEDRRSGPEKRQVRDYGAGEALGQYQVWIGNHRSKILSEEELRREYPAIADARQPAEARDATKHEGRMPAMAEMRGLLSRLEELAA